MTISAAPASPTESGTEPPVTPASTLPSLANSIKPVPLSLPTVRYHHSAYAKGSYLQEMMRIWNEIETTRSLTIHPATMSLHHTCPIVRDAKLTDKPIEKNQSSETHQSASSEKSNIRLTADDVTRIKKEAVQQYKKIEQYVKNMKTDSACSIGRLEELNLLSLFEGLVERKIKPDAQDDSGETLLTKIVTRYADEPEVNFFLIDACLQYGADMNKKNSQGMTALTLAVNNKKPILARHLFDRAILDTRLSNDDLGKAILLAAKQSGACLEEFLHTCGPRSHRISGSEYYKYQAPMKNYFRQAWGIARKNRNQVAMGYLKAHDVIDNSN
jgi:hypothetical protein